MNRQRVEIITDLEHEVLKYANERNFFPRYRELMERFDWKSPNSVSQILYQLERKQMLRKTPIGWQLTKKAKQKLCADS